MTIATQSSPKLVSGRPKRFFASSASNTFVPTPSQLLTSLVDAPKGSVNSAAYFPI